MKILKIEVIQDKTNLKRNPHYIGKITIGDFWETFYMNICFWNIDQYKQQWREGLDRIKTYDSSCLIADIYKAEEKVIMDIYYLYKINDKILVQYQLFDPQRCKALTDALLPFDPFNYSNRYRNIPPIELIDEDGNKLETWEADLDGIIIE